MGLFGKNKEEEQDDEYEEDDDEDGDTYSYVIECENCGEEIEYEIPLRTTVKTFKAQLKSENEKCDNCGCYVMGE